jgi:hypothetical protein
MRPIVLVHGFRVTPRSWENWTNYESKGHQAVAPAPAQKGWAQIAGEVLDRAVTHAE